MSEADSSLRLRPWASLLLFASAYAPLMLILVVKDVDPAFPYWVRHPWLCAVILLFVAISCLATLASVRNVGQGLQVDVVKASNKSGEMFAYTIPYILAFVKIELGDWQTLVSVAIFLAMLFAIAYRTQTVFVNPVLALAGYMLIDCTFKRNGVETQAMVIARTPLRVGQTCAMERVSHYLYVAAT